MRQNHKWCLILSKLITMTHNNMSKVILVYLITINKINNHQLRIKSLINYNNKIER